jgi:hypothetical protein
LSHRAHAVCFCTLVTILDPLLIVFISLTEVFSSMISD